METICLQMDESLLKAVDTAVERFRYSTRTEFIREAIRKQVRDVETEEIIKKLAEFKGKFRPKIGEKEASRLAMEELLKKHNLTLN